MVDPVSLGAIGAVLGAVGSGMANEAGKGAWESAGGPVRRIAGGETVVYGLPAPDQDRTAPVCPPLRTPSQTVKKP